MTMAMAMAMASSSLVAPGALLSVSSSSSSLSFFSSSSLQLLPPCKARPVFASASRRWAPPRASASGRSSHHDTATREFAVKDFAARRAFKVIAGLQNFDEERVASVVIAAEKGGATHVDIACSPDLVKMALGLSSLPVCVSAVEPAALAQAVDAGAHMVEIGNYDSFYESNRVFSAEEVLDLARQTRKLLPVTVLSVTVPHTLTLDEQVRLAEMLEKEGVDIIQTEGGTSSQPSKPGVHGLIEKAAPTLASAYSISRAVGIPVMCASGLSDVTAPLALAAGAAGVGVGSAVNKLNSQVAMIAAVRSIADALHLRSRVSAMPVSQVPAL